MSENLGRSRRASLAAAAWRGLQSSLKLESDFSIHQSLYENKREFFGECRASSQVQMCPCHSAVGAIDNLDRFEQSFDIHII